MYHIKTTFTQNLDETTKVPQALAFNNAVPGAPAARARTAAALPEGSLLPPASEPRGPLVVKESRMWETYTE